MNFSIAAAKANFFDRDLVIRAVGKARIRVLSKAGAFVRQRARSSIRKRKKISAPGGPPSSHEGSLKKFLFFAYDPQTETVVIGPARLNKGTGAPETLEYGGDTTIPVHHWVSGPKYGNRRQLIVTEKRIHILPRPYMGPALKAEAPNFAELWRDQVR